MNPVSWNIFMAIAIGAALGIAFSSVMFLSRIVHALDILAGIQ